MQWTHSSLTFHCFTRVFASLKEGKHDLKSFIDAIVVSFRLGGVYVG